MCIEALKAPTSLLSFATYLSFFPQLVAGPIVRAGQFLPQLESRSWVPNKHEDRQHIQRILTGFLKKVLLGDFIGAWIVDLCLRPHGMVSVEIWIALYGYSLQVYADFSGYTDMAKGMAGLLGIACPRTSIGRTKRPHRAILAPLAHHPFCMVERLRLHPHGRKPEIQRFSLGCLGMACAAIVWWADNLG